MSNEMLDWMADNEQDRLMRRRAIWRAVGWAVAAMAVTVGISALVLLTGAYMGCEGVAQ